MAQPAYKVLGTSTTSPIDNTKRKEVTTGQAELYSQQVNVGKMTYNDPELIGAQYEIWTKGAKARLLASGIIDTSAKSVRVFTRTAEDLEIIIGDNEWAPYVHGDRRNTEINGDER